MVQIINEQINKSKCEPSSSPETYSVVRIKFKQLVHHFLKSITKFTIEIRSELCSHHFVALRNNQDAQVTRSKLKMLPYMHLVDRLAEKLSV